MSRSCRWHSSVSIRVHPWFVPPFPRIHRRHLRHLWTIPVHLCPSASICGFSSRPPHSSAPSASSVDHSRPSVVRPSRPPHSSASSAVHSRPSVSIRVHLWFVLPVPRIHLRHPRTIPVHLCPSASIRGSSLPSPSFICAICGPFRPSRSHFTSAATCPSLSGSLHAAPRRTFPPVMAPVRPFRPLVR